MIIARAPLRVSFLGGGTDQPEYLEKYDGAVFSCAITKYVYIAAHENFYGKLRVAYSEVETVEDSSELKHPLFKAIFQYFNISKGLEVGSYADIPSSGTGLGSSSVFAVCLIKLIGEIKNLNLTNLEIARIAFEIEREVLKDPVGLQDHFASAAGGLNVLKFEKNKSVDVKKVNIDSEIKSEVSAHFKLLFTGQTRNAQNLLKEQVKNIREQDETVELLHLMKKLVPVGVDYFISKDYENFGKVLTESWELKKKLSKNISNPEIDLKMKTLLDNGAWGGKLLGAGAGGFILMVANPVFWEKFKTQFSNLSIFDLEIDSSGPSVIQF